jgi:quinoprotein dehydrogenase-associated probable ABC transporter substrate-binding protein
MSSAIKNLAVAVFCSALPLWASTADLRVCADPNNLPYSNQQQQGFENALAKLAASDLGMNLSYFWFPQRHKFFRSTLKAGVCDVVMEVPSGIGVASTTVPYFRSTYVFVSRRDRNLRIASFDDPRLKDLRIGVHMTGDSDEMMPTTSALLDRGLARNLEGYSIFGKLSEQNPGGEIVRAVADKNIDVAVVWGPLGGYFARNSSQPLEATPVCAAAADRQLPLSFDISMGVRPGNEALRQKLNDFIVRHRSEIRQLLNSYAVPLVNGPEATCE